MRRNINSLRRRLPQHTAWLATNPVDVIALQETKTPDELFPHAELGTDGWHMAFSGRRSYNGVAILSRTPLTDISTGIQGFPDEQKRVLAASIGDVRVIDLTCPTVRRLLRKNSHTN